MPQARNAIRQIVSARGELTQRLTREQLHILPPRETVKVRTIPLSPRKGEGKGEGCIRGWIRFMV